ncbi:MAG: DUF4442 domain-containing protein [Leptonema sp. (in: bacteria)]
MDKNKRIIKTNPYFLWDLFEKIFPANYIFSLYPPYLSAGIKVTKVENHYKYIFVELNLNFFNKNYVGTHFGGSLFAMTDPFYMLMFLKNLGKEYIVWDKKATIEFIKATTEDVYTEFILTDEEIQFVKSELETKKSLERIYIAEIKTKNDHQTIAKVEKTLYFRRLAK